MDELQSIGVGLIIGLVVIAFLTIYPGEPFEYIPGAHDVCTRKVASLTKTEDGSNTATEISDRSRELQHRQVVEIEQAAQHVKIEKLQKLLGLEKEATQHLVDCAKEKAKDAVKAHGQSALENYSMGSNGAWLDRGFVIVMFGLFAWALWQDYNINLFSIAVHVFPREVAVVRQVIDATRGLVC